MKRTKTISRLSANEFNFAKYCYNSNISLLDVDLLIIKDFKIFSWDLDYLFSYPYKFRGSGVVFEGCKKSPLLVIKISRLYYRGLMGEEVLRIGWLAT